MNIKWRKIISCKYHSRWRWCSRPFIKRCALPYFFLSSVLCLVPTISIVIGTLYRTFTASPADPCYTNSTPTGTRISSECSVKINFCVFTFLFVIQGPSRPVVEAVCTRKVLVSKYSFTVFILKKKYARSENWMNLVPNLVWSLKMNL